MKIADRIKERTQCVLLMDKKLEQRGFSRVLKKDMENLLQTYFYTAGSEIDMQVYQTALGKLDLKICLKNVSPRKIGIDA